MNWAELQSCVPDFSRWSVTRAVCGQFKCGQNDFTLIMNLMIRTCMHRPKVHRSPRGISSGFRFNLRIDTLLRHQRLAWSTGIEPLRFGSKRQGRFHKAAIKSEVKQSVGGEMGERVYQRVDGSIKVKENHLSKRPVDPTERERHRKRILRPAWPQTSVSFAARFA